MITHQLGVICHDDRSCGPVYDITVVSPVERLMWFMRNINERGIPVANPRYVAKVTFPNGRTKT